MKKARAFIALLLSIVFFTLFLSSCDDSGVNHLTHQRGIISFSQKNLRRVDPAVNGIYELWLRHDEGTTQFYSSLGKFNIGLDGKSMVDLSEQPMIFRYNGDTNLLNTVTTAILSLENLDFHTSPSSTILMSTSLVNTVDSISGKLTIGGELAMDQAGRNLYSAPHGRFTIQTPSTGAGTPECFKGLWFASATGDTALMPDGLALNPGRGWVYEGWVADTSIPSNPYYYSMGRFYDPKNTDVDGAGSCAGPNPGFNTPGQDWIQPACVSGKPDIVNIASGYYQVFISIEPEAETPGSPGYDIPFYFIPYKQGYIVPSNPCKRIDNIYNVARFFDLLPEGNLYITN